MNKRLPRFSSDYLREIVLHVGRRWLVLLGLGVIIGQLILMSIPYAIGMVVDSVRSGSLDVVALVVLAALWTCTYLSSHLVARVTSEVIQRVRAQSKITVYDSYVGKPEAYFVTHEPGRWAHYLEAISFSTRYLFGEGFPLMVRTIATTLIGAVIAATSAPVVGVITLVWAALYAPLSIVIARRSVLDVKAAMASTADVSSLVHDVLANHELVRAFHRTDDETARLRDLAESERRTYSVSQRRIDRGDLLQKLLLVAMPIGVLIYLQTATGLSSGGTALLLSLTLLMTSSLAGLGKSILAVFEHAERLRSAIDAAGLGVETRPVPEKIAVRVASSGTDRDSLNSWRIEAKSVSFSYGGTSDALSDVSLTIGEAEKVGIVGFSGAGKSTLLRLIRGAHVPDRGTITIGGEPISSYPSHVRRLLVAEVNQSAGIFNRSLRENLCYGLGNPSEESLRIAVANAQLDDVVDRLPDGLESTIGVKGESLSMGERARISIARAFLCDPRIVLLDEVFSSLDSENEQRIRTALGLLSANRTVIAVAHRLFTIHMMDRILVVDRGQIVADGSHEELMSQSCQYRRMYDAQRLS